jgi:hypothetical protein
MLFYSITVSQKSSVMRKDDTHTLNTHTHTHTHTHSHTHTCAGSEIYQRRSTA